MLKDVLLLSLFVAQLPAVAILLSRLLRGPGRYPPLQPQASRPENLGQVSVVVPTLNEAKRLTPCLTGLSQQSYEVREMIVVDSHSSDGTPDLVKAIQQRDPRFRLVNDDPLPSGWVGRPWALHHGFQTSSDQSEWILGLDADTQPHAGLIASLLAVARKENYDLISLAPCFILKDWGELLLHPALLMTLVYRFGPAGETGNRPERVMANGQCFFCRRSQLAEIGGYTVARQSFCDDVTLARAIATQGARVAFLDGSNVLKVRMYEGAVETWREWGRSLDLKDAATASQVWGDWLLLLAVQGLPIPVLLLVCGDLISGRATPVALAVFSLNLLLVLIRLGLNWAIAPSCDRTHARAARVFWFSPLADPIAVLRIFLSSLQTPTQWRGRSYGARDEGDPAQGIRA